MMSVIVKTGIKLICNMMADRFAEIRIQSFSTKKKILLRVQTLEAIAQITFRVQFTESIIELYTTKKVIRGRFLKAAVE